MKICCSYSCAETQHLCSAALVKNPKWCQIQLCTGVVTKGLRPQHWLRPSRNDTQQAALPQRRLDSVLMPTTRAQADPVKLLRPTDRERGREASRICDLQSLVLRLESMAALTVASDGMKYGKHGSLADKFVQNVTRSRHSQKYSKLCQVVDLRDLTQTELNKLPEQQRNSFPLPPRQNDRQCWQEYEEVCLKARKAAAKRKDKITKELKWQSGAAARQHIQQQYPTKQKQMNKQFFGEATDKKQQTCVLDTETRRMLNDPDAVLEYVQSSFQEQAKPASGCAKTKDFTPNDGNRKYPWKHGAYSSIDPFTLETAAGKQEFGSISLLEHVQDPCIFQEKLRHLENGKAPGPDGIPNELLKHLPEGVHQVIHKLFILMWMTGTTPRGMEGVSNSAPA